ncbi:hypothetical protein N7510_007826 [Penicillium lagena]|uniref:uncharacterized protein n=1 Tax=Penicillium lagena TaxID=94218 RepID=UPI002540D94E|nr:uncharacterized protein N7510_007826 [Penicillium lagena]KAJ5611107.1 hypothetical protein N7510_007826 [Penicillium lagena]
MKVVDFFLYLVTVSSAVVVADEQALLSPGHGKNNDDRLNAIDERLLLSDEATQADGMYSFRETMFIPTWLDILESSYYGGGRNMVFFDENSVFEDFDEEDDFDDAATAGNRRLNHFNSGSSNMTIYELIKTSQFTTKLAALIDADENKELARILNDSTVNHTVFVPTDCAFDKISNYPLQLSPGAIRKILYYHISPGTTQVSQDSFTVPTLYKEPALGGDLPQRLSIRANDWEPTTVNFYARLVANNIRASNGIIQVVDSILMPPPSTLSVLNLLPTKFSALSLGLTRTNLSSTIEAMASACRGGTFFAPSNAAFDMLGPRISAFLFSAQGEKYLRALLEYHVVRNQTLYSDVWYNEAGKIERLRNPLPPSSLSSPSPPSDAFLLAQLTKNANLPQLSTLIELPTMLGNRTIAVDIKQRGPFSKFMVNGYQHIVVATDGVARDGSIIVLDNVLIPSKKGARHASSRRRYFYDGDMCDTLEEFKARFAGLVTDDGNGDDFESDLFAFLDSPSS